jgi:hypothetical protein
MPCSWVALETGMHSPWARRLLSELGDDLILAHARNVLLMLMLGLLVLGPKWRGVGIGVIDMNLAF